MSNHEKPISNVTRSLFKHEKHVNSYEEGKVSCATFVMRVEAEGGKRKNKRKAIKGEKGRAEKKSREEEIKKKKCRIALHFVPGASPGRQAGR